MKAQLLVPGIFPSMINQNGTAQRVMPNSNTLINEDSVTPGAGGGGGGVVKKNNSLPMMGAG